MNGTMNPNLMTPTERRASGTLASIFALRMLGMFLVLPVFAIEAARYPGGTDASLVGLTMGLYGLTQAALQLPFGLASDRLGRKRVIVAGLLVFALGSFVAGAADSLQGLMIGRALQGAGAVSAAVTALLADLTRDSVRTKSMALVGASIGLMFALSLVAAPLLNSLIGLPGLFVLTGILALIGIVVVIWAVPPEPTKHADIPRGGLGQVLRDPALVRMNVGVFILHAVQMAMWLALPAMLVEAGIAQEHHWWVYLPAVLASFVVMGMTLFPLEKRGYLRAVFLVAIGTVALVQLGLLGVASSLAQSAPGLRLMCLSALLFLFFCGFNVLEASQPSLVSKLSPAHAKGAAMGVYNTLMSFGLFAGGAAGGLVLKAYGVTGLFLTGTVLMGLWLVVAWPMRQPVTAVAPSSPEQVAA